MDRTVVVRLVAMVGQYNSHVTQAIARTRALQASVGDVSKSSRAAGEAATQAAKANASAMSGMASAMRSMRGMLVGLGLPLAVGALAKQFLDFEQKMAHVKAVADDFGRSATGIKALRDTALEAGRAYGFTATEVATAQESLLKAGRSTAQVLGGELNAAMTLAAAGTISLDEAATITATTMTIFGDAAGGATHVANQLVGAANATVSGVQEMGTALSYVGPVAHSLGVSLEETVATISVFNQAGIEGDRAGTNLRGMLTNLLSPSAMARAEMTRLGVDLFDNKGKFVGMANAAQILHDKIGSLGNREQAEAIGRLTTNASMPGFIVLMRGGAEVVQKMEKAIRDSATAEQVAAEKLDSVTGEFQKFGSAVSSAAIRVGGALAPALSGVARTLTSVTKGFGEMGGAAQLALLALGAQLLLARRLHGAYNSTRTAVKDLTAAQIRLNRDTGGRGTAFIGPLSRDGTSSRQMLQEASTVRRLLAETRANVAVATTGWERFQARGVGAFRGIGAAARGLVGFLGGGWGVAFAGLMAGVAAWQAEVARSQRVSDNLRSGIQLLGLEFAQTGEISANAMRETFKNNPDMAWVLENTQAIGVSMRDVARASIGEADAVNHVAEGMDDYGNRAEDLADKLEKSFATKGPLSRLSEELTSSQRAAVDALNVPVREPGWIGGKYAGQTQATIERLRAVAERSHKAAEEFREQHKSELALIKAEKEMAEANLAAELEKLGYRSEDASEALRILGGNLATMNSPAAEFGDRIKAMAANVDLLADAFNSAASAQAAFFGAAQEGLADAFTEAESATGGAGGGGGGGGGAPKYGTTRTWDEDVDAKGQRTRREMATTRRPDGTTTVTTTTTAPDGKKTTETRRSYDSADVQTAAAKPKRIAPQIDPVTEQFDVTTEVGRKQHELTSKTVTAATDAAKAIFTQTALAGNNTAEAMEYAGTVATAEFMRMRDEAVKQMTDLTGNAELAKRIIDEYYPSAREFAESVNAKGADELVLALEKAGVKMRALSHGRVALLVDDKAAAEKLAEFGGKLKKLPDGSFKVVFENQDAANKALESTITKKKTVAKPVPFKVKADTYATNLKLRELVGARTILAEQVDVVTNTPTHERAAGDLNDLIAKANYLDRQQFTIDVQLVGYETAAAAVQSLARQIDEHDMEQYGLRGVRPELNEFPSKGRSTGPFAAPLPRRWGGITAAASGTLRDAMIAGTGTRYQWAEPETGGEAFVPRNGKYGRSMGILSRAAAWYGAKVTPASSSAPAWGRAKLQSAGPQQVQITVRGEGVLAGMIEATVDGRLVKVAQTVANRRVR